VFIGVVSAAISNLLTSLKGFFRFDDAMDIYACHGVAGIVGLVFTGVFCQASVAANDGYTAIAGGWIDGNYIQVGYQFAWICATWGWVSSSTRTHEFERSIADIHFFVSRRPLSSAGFL
jgi:Amt family ammonium transporter